MDNAVAQTNKLKSEIAKLEAKIPSEDYRSFVENEIRCEIGINIVSTYKRVRALQSQARAEGVLRIIVKHKDKRNNPKSGNMKRENTKTMQFFI